MPNLTTPEPLNEPPVKTEILSNVVVSFKKNGTYLVILPEIVFAPEERNGVE